MFLMWIRTQKLAWESERERKKKQFTIDSFKFSSKIDGGKQQQQQQKLGKNSSISLLFHRTTAKLHMIN